MDNNASEKDPWANLGNMGSGNKSGEVSAEGLAREKAWNDAMRDAPEFAGNTTPFYTQIETFPEVASPESNDAAQEPGEERDESISGAADIIKYGLNAAAKEYGVEVVIQTINNFVPNGQENPIRQLFRQLGVDSKTEVNDVREEARAAQPRLNEFITEDINAPTTLNKSNSGAMNAIKEVKELVAEVQTSPDYALLRAEAMKFGKGVFEYAVYKYNVRDLTVLFDALSEYKKEATKPAEASEEPSETDEKANDISTPEEIKLTHQIENHSSSANSGPDTDAAASNGSLL